MYLVCYHNPVKVFYSTNPLHCGILLVILLISVQSSFAQSNQIQGRVFDHEGIPLGQAVVRIPADAAHVFTKPDGTFQLSIIPESGKTRLTAWKQGYYIAGADWKSSNDYVEIILQKHHTKDNAEYKWLEPDRPHRNHFKNASSAVGLFLANTVPFSSLFHRLNETMDLGCVDCHGKNMYEEWIGGAHAAGNKNLRFMSMYNGTDIDGNKSSEPRYYISRDYGASPLPPKRTDAYFGPGYKLDFPFSAGNCAACHLPGAAIDRPYDTDPNDVTGIDRRGSHCDFCHKISDVVLEPGHNIPYENRPGVLSYEFLRPEKGQQIFFGPYDDVDAGTDVYLPLIRKSEYCSGCHDASFWNVPIYKSYSEWYQSPYRDMGITCQHCHMKPDGYTTNFARNRGGLERDPNVIATHRFEGAMDSDLLQHALSLHVQASIVNSQLNLQVLIENDRTGHHVPTDSPLRQVILLVQTTDSDGRQLKMLSGPAIPEWGGVGDPATGNYAGLPGQIYSKVLEELWTGEAPSGSYWMPTRVVLDNRIEAFHADTSYYLFDLLERDQVQVDVKLIYRRAPKKLMEQKKWDTPDILMSQFQGVYR
jgi:hypothetical protein